MKTILWGPSIMRDHGAGKSKMAFWSLLLLAFALFPIAGFCGHSETETWKGGIGNWDSHGKWDCSAHYDSHHCQPPDGHRVDVKIGTHHHNGVVYLNHPTTVNKLTIGDGGNGILNVEGSHHSHGHRPVPLTGLVPASSVRPLSGGC